MSRPLLFQRLAAIFTAWAGLTLAGCAVFETPVVPAFRDTALTMTSAQTLIVPGTSTRRDVMAALGPASVVVFDSGFEVWAYRDKRPRASAGSAELVILFSPSGTVTKTRLRLPSALPAP